METKGASVAHPELESEQQQLDRAYTLLDHQSAQQNTDERRPHLPLIFGRVDDDGQATYVGRHDVTDQDGRAVVVAWHSPSAAAFYRAADPTEHTHTPWIFTAQDRRLTALHDRTTAARQAVERFRDGTPRPATATLDHEQYDAITQPTETTIIVTGGPGTGKTLVGLHRAAWIAHNRPDLRAAGITVVVAPHALDDATGILDMLDVADVTCTADADSLTAEAHGHIVIDAPHLSPTALDALTRARPTGATTLIHDHTSDPDQAHHARQLAPDARHVTLTTSYRLPRPVVDLAVRQLALIPHDTAPAHDAPSHHAPPNVPVAIRDGIGAPLVWRGNPDEIAADALRAADAAASTGFKVGVVVPRARLEATLRLAAEAGSKVGDVREGDLSRPVSVLTAPTAHGLEYDAVAVVAPDEIVAESGHATLYLAVTRCAQSLAIFHAEPLPGGMQHLTRPPTPEPTGNADLHTLIDALDENDTVIVEALVHRLLSH